MHSVSPPTNNEYSNTATILLELKASTADILTTATSKKRERKTLSLDKNKKPKNKIPSTEDKIENANTLKELFNVLGSTNNGKKDLIRYTGTEKIHPYPGQKLVKILKTIAKNNLCKDDANLAEIIKTYNLQMLVLYIPKLCDKNHTGNDKVTVNDTLTSNQKGFLETYFANTDETKTIAGKNVNCSEEIKNGLTIVFKNINNGNGIC